MDRAEMLSDVSLRHDRMINELRIMYAELDAELRSYRRLINDLHEEIRELTEEVQALHFEIESLNGGLQE